jgi:hypothetical protein
MMKWTSFSFKNEAMWMLLFPFVSAALAILVGLIVLFLRWSRMA